MRRERVTEEEIRAALRAQGVGSQGEADAVVLETDGSFTALKQAGDGAASALRGVAGADPDAAQRAQAGHRDGGR